MRVFALAGLIVAVALSGCAGGSPLNNYLIQPMDVPSDCHYMSMKHPQLAEFQKEYNLTGNPGSIDNEILGWEFADGEASVVANRLAIYECEDGDIFSLAMQFSDTNATASFDEDSEPCAYSEYGEYTFANGPFFAFIELDGVDTNGTAQILQRMTLRTGAQPMCDEY